jgi:hypothetical protein
MHKQQGRAVRDKSVLYIIKLQPIKVTRRKLQTILQAWGLPILSPVQEITKLFPEIVECKGWIYKIQQFGH